jgi:hypothetical protein
MADGLRREKAAVPATPSPGIATSITSWWCPVTTLRPSPASTRDACPGHSKTRETVMTTTKHARAAAPDIVGELPLYRCT